MFLERLAEEKRLKNAVFIDIGNTTTTIIPVVNGKIAVRVNTDPEKLVFGEFIYTSVLRTNVCAVIDKVPYKGALGQGIFREICFIRRCSLSSRFYKE